MVAIAKRVDLATSLVARMPGTDFLSLQRNVLQGDCFSREVLHDAYEQVGASPLEQRSILASAWDAEGRADVARLWRDELPHTAMKRRRSRIESMTKAETARMPAHAQRWLDIGLSTARADRPLYEAGVHAIYRSLGWGAPRIVWTSSPIAVALAAPIAAYLIAKGAVDGAVRGAVRDAVDGAVGGAVGGAVRDAVGGAVGGAVRGAVRDAVVGAVGGAVDGAVGGAVRDAVGDAVGDARQTELHTTLSRLWHHYMGGQFWVGGYWWYGSPSNASFFLDDMRLKIDPVIETRARAYWATSMSASWWWPHREFVIVSDRPTELRKRDRTTLDSVSWSWRDHAGNQQSWKVGGAR